MANSKTTLSDLDKNNYSNLKLIVNLKTLEKYNDIFPDDADRIMTIFEDDCVNRRKVENKEIDYKHTQAILGQILGFISGILALGCGTYLSMIGERTAGGIVFGITIGLVGVFVIRKFYYPNKSA